MIYLLACVEGESTEPNIVDGIVLFLRSQKPQAYKKVEVETIPLSGNHGHLKLIERAKAEAEKYIREYDIQTPPDEVKKYLVVDFDRLNEHGIDYDDFRKKIIQNGFIPIFTRPKIEYFIARLFYDKEELTGLTPAQIDQKITEGIDNFNEGKDEILRIPPYGKKKSEALRCLQTMFNLDPVFLERAKNIEVEHNGEQFTEMAILIEEFCNLLDY